MSDLEMLKQWKSSTEKRLVVDKEKLQELKETQELDVKRYVFYASLIKHWLKNEKDNLSDGVREEFRYDLGYLESQPEQIINDIMYLENSIEKDTIVISKLNEIIE